MERDRMNLPWSPCCGVASGNACVANMTPWSGDVQHMQRLLPRPAAVSCRQVVPILMDDRSNTRPRFVSKLFELSSMIMYILQYYGLVTKASIDFIPLIPGQLKTRI